GCTYSATTFLEAAQQAARMLVGTLVRMIETRTGQPAHLAFAFARGETFGRFLVQGLRNDRRTTRGAGRDDTDDKALDASRDAQSIIDMNQSRRFRGSIVDLDLAALDGLLGEAARLVETRGPKPNIQAHAGIHAHMRTLSA